MLVRKIISATAALVIGTAALTACGAAGSSTTQDSTVSQTDKTSDKLSIVCTIFPEYDWVKEILGENADRAQVTYLLDNGIDLHSFQPTADDMMKISTCDIFIYVGGESDGWVENALETAENKDIRVIELMDILGGAAKEEELKEGMQEEEEESGEEEGEEEEPEYDEHVWLSVRNARLFCEEIERNIAEADPEYAEAYGRNLESYTAELDMLDSDLQALADRADIKTLVFGDRFPFRYFTDDYGFDYYAAFIGCSAETEASFDTIAFLAQKVNELECDTIFTLENSDKSIAETIISTSGRDARIAELDSLQSVYGEDIENGASYISLMRKNLDVLNDVLVDKG